MDNSLSVSVSINCGQREKGEVENSAGKNLPALEEMTARQTTLAAGRRSQAPALFSLINATRNLGRLLDQQNPFRKKVKPWTSFFDVPEPPGPIQQFQFNVSDWQRTANSTLSRESITPWPGGSIPANSCNILINQSIDNAGTLERDVLQAKVVNSSGARMHLSPYRFEPRFRRFRND